ncbi:MAG: O-antigen ligase family protein [Nitrospiraceae bacterium]|nr:O-antigen ligase family protein [Nitrospiraceae bacterium]
MTEPTSHPSHPANRVTLVLPSIERDEWAACRDRANAILRSPGVLLPWLFGLAFGIAYALMTGESAGWVLAGVLLALMLLVVGASHLKFWVTFYPLVFLVPTLSLGSWVEGGEKLFGLLVYEPWILVLLCLWIPRFFVAKRLGLPRNVKIALGGLVGIGLVAIWVAPDRLFALRTGVRTLFEPLFLFVLITSLPWKQVEIRQVVRILLSVATVTAGLSLFTYATEGGTGGAGGIIRLGSSWEGPNVLAAYMGAVACIALGWLLSANSRIAVLAGLVVLLTASLALMLTYARGTWIGLAVALALMTAQLRAWIWGILFVPFITLVVLTGPADVLQRAASIFYFTEERSAVNRLILWPKVVDLIADQPLTGYGFGGFQILFSEQPGIESYHAHNLFLDFALALGIPGLLLFLWFVGYVLLRALTTFRRFRRAEGLPLLLGLCAGCLCMLAAGQTDGGIIVIWASLAHIFWFLLAFTYALTVTVERELRPPPEVVSVRRRGEASD